MVDFNDNRISISDPRMTKELKELAKKADKAGDSDGFINTAFDVEMNEIYKGFRALDDSSKASARSIFGNNSGTVNDEPMVQISKTGKKAAEKTVLQKVSSQAAKYYTPYSYNMDPNKPEEVKKSIEKPINWSNIAKDIQTAVAASVMDADYSIKLGEEIQKVADTMNKVKLAQEYNSRDDISKLYKEVKKQLDLNSNDEFKDFKLNVLKEFVLIAESHQKDKEKSRLMGRYYELANDGLKYNVKLSDGKDGEQITKRLTRTQIAEQLGKEFKGSYYSSYFKDQVDEFNDPTNQNVTKHDGLLKELENTKIKSDAEKQIQDVIYSLRKPTPKEIKSNQKLLEDYNARIKQYGLEKYDLTDGKDIEKAAKLILEKDKQNDKYTDEAFSGKGTRFGDRSLIKDFRKWVAAKNRVEARKAETYTGEQLRKVVKDDAVIKNLVDNKTLIAEKDGKYDISALSDLIRDTISKGDYRLNYQKVAYSEFSELDNVVRAIKDRTGVAVTTDDAQKLVDFCGFDRDKKNLAVDLLKGAAKGIVPGLVNYGTSQLLESCLEASQDIVVNTAVKSVANTTVDVSKINQRLYSLMVPINVNGQAIIDTTIAIMPTMTDADGNSVDVVANYNKSYIQNALRAQGFSSEIVQNGNAISIHITGTVSGDPQQAMVKLGDLLENHFEIKSEDIDVTTDVQTEVNTDTSGSSAEVVRKPWRDFAWVMGVNMAMGALQEAFAEMPGEEPVLSWEVATNDINKYISDLNNNKHLSPKMKEAIALMATSFQKDGAWDAKGYENYLKQIAGGGVRVDDGTGVRTSFLNIKELYNGTYELLKSIKAEPQPAKKINREPQQTVIPSATKELEVKKETELKDYEPKTVRYYGWDNQANGYTCLQRPEFQEILNKKAKVKVSVANRMMKIIQAIDYSKAKTNEELKEMLNAKTIAEFAKEAEFNGIDAAIQKYPKLNVDKNLYKAVLRNKIGVDKAKVPDLYHPDDAKDGDSGFCTWAKPDKIVKTMNSNVKTNESAVRIETKKITINGKTKFMKRTKGSNEPWQNATAKEYNDCPNKVS